MHPRYLRSMTLRETTCSMPPSPTDSDAIMAKYGSNVDVKYTKTNTQRSWRVNNVYLQIESEENKCYYREMMLKLKIEFSWKFIQQSLETFWRSLKMRLRNFFIEANEIPAYRWEWKKKYQKWKYQSPTRPIKSAFERAKCSMEKRRSRLIKTLKHKGDPRIHHSGKMCQVIVINVSGTIFHAQERTFQFPDTLLGSLEQRIRYFDPCSNQYFFERNASCFVEILNWYQRCGQKLTRPSKIPTSIFERELRFFGIPLPIIKSYRDKEEGQTPEPDKVLPSHLLKRKYWLLFEYAESSKQAKMIVFGSLAAIMLTIFCFCLESLTIFNDKDVETLLVKNSLRDPFFISETICIIWFTLETIVRFLCCPNKWEHMTNLLNILDIVSILPYYIQTIIIHGTGGEEFHGSTKIVQFLRITRVSRVFRIFKLSRHSTSLKILGKTLSASLQELILLIFLLLVTMVLFATAAYYGDYGPNNPFSSIPHAFWWALNTLTTVGYGDIYPISFWGRIVGMICCVAGILYVALPVPVIVANFNYYYGRYNDANDELPSEAEHKIMRSHHQNECEFRPACGMSPDCFNLKNFPPEDREIYREVIKKRAIEKRIFQKTLRKTLNYPPRSTDSSSSEEGISRLKTSGSGDKYKLSNKSIKSVPNTKQKQISKNKIKVRYLHSAEDLNRKQNKIPSEKVPQHKFSILKSKKGNKFMNFFHKK